NLVLILFDFYGRDLAKYSIIRSIIGLTSYPENLSFGILNSTLMNPNYISGFAGALTAFFLTKALIYTGKKRTFHAVLSVLSFIVILASLSTSGFLSFLALIPIIALIAFIKKRGIKTLFTSLIILSCFCVSFLVLYTHTNRVWDETIGFFTGRAQSLTEELAVQQDDNDEFTLSNIKQTASSGRVYIWRKTIELIKERPLLGYGHDTLLYHFSQFDPEQAENLGFLSLVTKPHNMYLEVAFGSGLIALISLLALLILHLFHTTKTIIKGNNDKTRFSASILVFWCAFLLQCLFNDSLIGTSPIFWILFGVAVSFNSSLKLSN
nr:O-antigen ligase family protein [Bacteroidales bacterium]